jgi:hypothetical protein
MRIVVFVSLLFVLGCGSSTPPGGNKDYDRPRDPVTKKPG